MILLRPQEGDRGGRITLRTTHASWVYLTDGDAWKVMARAYRDDGGPGRDFSYTILAHVVAEGRTFFQSNVRPTSASASRLHGRWRSALS